MSIENETPLFFDSDEDDDYSNNDENNNNVDNNNDDNNTNNDNYSYDDNNNINLNDNNNNVDNANKANVQTIESSDNDLEIVKQSASKKRKLSRDESVIEIPSDKSNREPFNRFIGEITIDGWSTVNGKGYVSNGDSLLIERDKSTNKKPASNSKAKITSFKGFAAKASKNSENTIIRFRNNRGFEIGRIPSNHSSYLSKLLDGKVIELRGVVVDCDETLRSGDTIIISVQVYLHSKAFSKENFSDKRSSSLGQILESEEENKLASRRDALLKLFKYTKLEPIESNSITIDHRRKDVFDNSHAQLDHFKEASHQINQVENKKRNSDVVVIDDSSDDNEDDNKSHSNSSNNEDDNAHDKVNDEQLESVYRRAQGSARSLKPLDPPSSFILDLRNYQKEALGWMTSVEMGDNEPKENVIHPLWEKYQFKQHPLNNSEPSYFYFNPYSSELSKNFPSASKTLRGGIQGDEMGMGKTIMVTALLHQNKTTDMSWYNQQNISGKGKQRRIDDISMKKNDAIVIDESDEDNYKPSQNESNKKQKKSNNNNKSSKSSTRVPGGFKLLSDTTLIVVPMSLLGQWRDEILRSSEKGSVRVVTYYGDSKGNLENQLKRNTKVESEDGTVVDYSNAFKVVITSYGVLISDYNAFEKSSYSSEITIPTLFDYYWHRVVLDEAHHIKNRSTLNAKAAFQIAAYRRWALTGTPIVNRLEDLFSLLKYLKVEPWSDFTFFRSFITIPFSNRDPKAIELIQVILANCLIRREKNMKDSDGKSIVNLPKKTVQIVKLEFSPEERQIYNALYNKAKRKFDALSHKGMLLKSFSSILTMLLRLRQAALHPFLVTSKTSKNDNEDDEIKNDNDDISGIDIQSMIAKFAAGGDSNYAAQVLKDLTKSKKNDDGENDENDDENDCPICFEDMILPVLLPCMHKSCKECVLGYFDKLEDKGEETSCPVCRKGPIRTDQLLEVVYDEPSSQQEQMIRLRKAHNFKSSVKLNALIESLQDLRKVDRKFKAVVFSQFTGFLDLAGDILKSNQFKFLRLDGSTSQKHREDVLKELNEIEDNVILLISLKAGGVGLNLTSANHVYLMDVWWNEAIENQAIDRVHRIGQERDVNVIRFCVKDTIEDRVLQIQQRKSVLVDNALGGKSTEHNRKERIENLRLMFSN